MKSSQQSNSTYVKGMGRKVLPLSCVTMLHARIRYLRTCNFETGDYLGMHFVFVHNLPSDGNFRIGSFLFWRYTPGLSNVDPTGSTSHLTIYKAASYIFVCLLSVPIY